MIICRTTILHYTQSMDLYDYRINRRWGFILSGKENGNVVAARLLTDAHIKVFKYFYTHRGPDDFTLSVSRIFL